MFRWNFLNFIWCTSPLILLLSSSEKILLPSSLLFLQEFLYMYEISVKHLSSQLNSSSSQGQILQSLNCLHSTLLDKLWHVFSSLVLQSPDPAIQMCLTRTQKRERVSFSLQEILLQPMRQLAFFATRAQTAVLFVSAELLSRQGAPSTG